MGVKKASPGRKKRKRSERKTTHQMPRGSAPLENPPARRGSVRKPPETNGRSQATSQDNQPLLKTFYCQALLDRTHSSDGATPAGATRQRCERVLTSGVYHRPRWGHRRYRRRRDGRARGRVKLSRLQTPTSSRNARLVRNADRKCGSTGGATWPIQIGHATGKNRPARGVVLR